MQVVLQHQAGALELNVSFTARAPWTVLFGPSGSGKTTVLRAIAGFLAPERGRIVVTARDDGHSVLFDSRSGVAQRPDQRPVRTAGQRAQMFARRTVRENVKYGAGGDERAVRDALDLLQLSSLAESSVERLSGGEQQRVAVARAVAAARAIGPGTWLLLDEPFTGLDLTLRGDLIRQLRPWLAEAGHPVLSVTHDVAEVFALDAQVVRFLHGRIVATGTAHEVLAPDRLRVLSELEM